MKRIQVVALVIITLMCFSALAEAKEKKLYTRDEFIALVAGKTTKEVIDAVGKPIETSYNGGFLVLTYSKITVDPITDKRDFRALVFLKDGVVETDMIDFY